MDRSAAPVGRWGGRPRADHDFNDFEALMAADGSGLGPVVAGAARQVRAELAAAAARGELTPAVAGLRALGADVAGQSMTAFALWLAEESKRAEVEHLLFMARDGELPLQIARALPSDHWRGQTLRYLHCSRSTWSLAAALPIGVDRWLAEGAEDPEAFAVIMKHRVPLRALLARVGLQPDDLPAERHPALAGLDPELPLPTAADDAWASLLADPVIRRQIAERADERFRLITDRLRQDGTVSGRYGLVDVGWRGRFASHVGAVLGSVLGEDPVHFHFGGDRVPPDVDLRLDVRRFAFDSRRLATSIDRPISCVETLTGGGGARIAGYGRATDGSVEMIFDEPERGDRSLHQDLRAGALAVAEHIPDRAELDRCAVATSPLDAEVRAVLERWWNRPTRAEAALLARFAVDIDERGTEFRPLIVPYRWRDIGAVIRGHTIRGWPRGSAMVGGRLTSVLVRAAWALRRRLTERRGPA